MKSRTPYQIASRDPRLTQLTAEARALLKMDKQFRRLLPDAVAAGCQAVRIEGGELLLFADNGLIAARLRLIAPGLLPRLAALGYPADRVKVRVSPRLPPVKRQKQSNISEKALDGIEAAADTVKDPLVADALAKLIAHHRR
ncbi:MAG: DUF721 domain-containing protein [Paludibacterium sp.]|uniref:DciA family protein n=1 Tax=Paludibacterium sp. TaxID=1917523 RepID=UPI0025DC0BB7|nr:DciA family protein [Paludibacterium sp.]MBV8048937.1 DUF721 domain-containing protein [Paludibacterium sp.]MBV8647789.1 DUF721 domain-containing protein [Paludibacterium sp.]